MSLPGPVPYEARRFGSEREAPAKRAMRPYAERLNMSDRLVAGASVPKGSSKDMAIRFIEASLFLGAVLPILFAIPGFGSLFTGVQGLLGPAIPSAATALYAGWWGALVVVIGGGTGILVARAHRTLHSSASAEARWLFVGFDALIMMGGVSILARTAPYGASGAAAGGAVVMVAMAGALYGVLCAARRENWLAAVIASCGVISLTSAALGTVALLLLIYSARAFPGQVVARHPWKRTEVAIEPIEQPGGLEPGPEEGGVHPRERAPLPQGLYIAKVALVFGAFAPFVLALPWFGIELFGPLLALIFPLSIPIMWSGALLQASFIVLSGTARFGPMVGSAIVTILWLLVLPIAGAVVGARAAAKKRRPWAAVAGAVLLIIGGRPIFGIIALWAIAYSWRAFEVPVRSAEDEQAPKEGAPGASAQ